MVMEQVENLYMGVDLQIRTSTLNMSLSVFRWPMLDLVQMAANSSLLLLILVGLMAVM